MSIIIISTDCVRLWLAVVVVIIFLLVVVCMLRLLLWWFQWFVLVSTAFRRLFVCLSKKERRQAGVTALSHYGRYQLKTLTGPLTTL